MFYQQNILIMNKASRFPLCIDPQNFAMKWIKEKENENGLRILHYNMTDYLFNLEKAITAGESVLIEDIDGYIDTKLYNLLEQSFKSE